MKSNGLRKKTNVQIRELPNTDFTIDIDLAILATGFVHVQHEGLIKDLDLKLDDRGNVLTLDYQTSNPKVFAAGDTISGPSLVVHAINTADKREARELVKQFDLEVVYA